MLQYVVIAMLITANDVFGLIKKTTLEVNTPSHEQCVVSHLERNTTKQWLLKQQTNQGKYKDINIKELNYLDPFEEYKNWK